MDSILAQRCTLKRQEGEHLLMLVALNTHRVRDGADSVVEGSRSVRCEVSEICFYLGEQPESDHMQ